MGRLSFPRTDLGVVADIYFSCKRPNTLAGTVKDPSGRNRHCARNRNQRSQLLFFYSRGVSPPMNRENLSAPNLEEENILFRVGKEGFGDVLPESRPDTDG